MPKYILAILAVAFVIGSPLALSADEDSAIKQAAAKVAVELCSACHGPEGNSTSPDFPKLAGQQKLYLAAQIRAFKNRTRGESKAHDYMWGMAGTIDDSLVDALADYYASQKPAPGRPGDPKLMPKGKQLFENGDSSRNIHSCASCHGVNAEGNGIFPRLAGQHAPYMASQLQVIQKNLRESPVMHGVVTALEPNEIKYISEFLQAK